MTDNEFDTGEFLDWLEEQDGYRVSANEINENWSGFYDHFSITGVTMTINEDTGEKMVPKRDFRQAVLYGTPLD